MLSISIQLAKKETRDEIGPSYDLLGFSWCAGNFCASGQQDERQLIDFAVSKAFHTIEMECFTMIDRACMAMKKTKEEFSKLLVGE